MYSVEMEWVHCESPRKDGGNLQVRDGAGVEETALFEQNV